MIQRRNFMRLLGGAAAAPIAARGQQPQRTRRIGVLMNIPADDPQAQLYLAAFQQGLQELGWTVGRNLRIDHRWGPSTSRDQRLREQVAELVVLTPDVIVWAGGAGGDTQQQVSRTVPVVLTQAIDPVGSGTVASLSRPRRNITGFTQFEFSLGGKWLQLLKEIAPRIMRVGVLRSAGPAGIGQWAVIQAAAETIGVECKPLIFDNLSEIEGGIAEFERGGNAGLIVSLNSFVTVHRQTIIASAARYRLPAVYPFAFFSAAGGLLSYGSDLTEQWRGAAGYVDRILRGEKAADLPVQKPTKYELVVNLKTAKALGLEVPPTLLVRADQVIE